MPGRGVVEARQSVGGVTDGRCTAAGCSAGPLQAGLPPPIETPLGGVLTAEQRRSSEEPPISAFVISAGPLETL